MNSVEVIELKPKKQPMTIMLQMIFVVAVFIAGMMTLFSKMWMPLLYAMLTLALLTMAWNNYKLAKKKKIAILYLVFAMVTLVSTVLELL